MRQAMMQLMHCILHSNCNCEMSLKLLDSKLLDFLQDQCQNYIRVAERQEEGVLLICGTNSYKPSCRRYVEVRMLVYFVLLHFVLIHFPLH